MRLCTYWRSSASYRVRIALELKNHRYELVPINLKNLEHQSSIYRETNPQGMVPVLMDGSAYITQSLAIIEYLEEMYPATRRVLPLDPTTRAHARALSHIIACDTHPLQNPRVSDYLYHELGMPISVVEAWRDHWILSGLVAYEAMRERFQKNPHSYGTFSVGNSPTIADCCLIPQMYNAKRFGINIDALVGIRRVYDACMQLPSFQRASPEQQPDAPHT